MSQAVAEKLNVQQVQVELRAAMDRCVHDSLKPVALATSIAYLLLAQIYALNPQQIVSGTLSLLATATAAAIFLVWHVIDRRPVSPKAAHPIAVLLMGVVLANILLHFYMVRESQGTTSIAMFIVGIGCLLLSLRWVVVTLFATNAASAWIAWQSMPSLDWLNFIYLQAAASVLSLCIYALRARTFQRLELARIHDDRYKRKLEDALQTLKQSEVNFRTLSESVPVGIFRTDENGRCTYTNTTWQSITGLVAQTEQSVRWDDAIHVDERAVAFEIWQAAVAREEAFSGTFRLNVSDGRSRWAHFNLNTSRTGAEISHFGALEDITDRKRAEEDLKQHAEDLKIAKLIQDKNTERLAQVVEELEVAKRRAEESTRSKSEFLANMSHEIRTPMTAILGYTDVLIDRTAGDPTQLDSLETIKRNGEHLLQIINDILDLSKIEAGRLEIEKIRCSPFQVLEDVMSLMQIRAKEKGLPLSISYETPLPESIETDPTRLRQILFNLVGNALKFTNTGSVSIIARCTRKNMGRRAGAIGKSVEKALLEIDVIDTGIGMGPNQLMRLFQPFTQADMSTSRKFGGTGLGLNISNRLATMLNGTIRVESTAGEGSRFRLTLDAGTLEGVEMVERKPPSLVDSLAKAAQKKEQCKLLPEGCRILVAEDGIDNQRLICFLLSKVGAHVEIAENGAVACDLAIEAQGEGTPFDLIVMDMQMPVLDGYGATRKLREQGYHGPIVALTAHAMRGDRQKCLSAGCDDYATKPIDRGVFLQVVRDQLARANGKAPESIDATLQAANVDDTVDTHVIAVK